MRKSHGLAVAATVSILATAGSAEAQGVFGIGVESPLTTVGVGADPLGAASLVYDAGSFHIDGLLEFASTEDEQTTFGVGGRAFFVVHEGSASDFSLGGGLSILHTDFDAPDDEVTDIHLEGSGKIRAFLADNVAVHGTVGLGVVLADDDNDFIGLFGRLSGALGITYFFD